MTVLGGVIFLAKMVRDLGDDGGAEIVVAGPQQRRRRLRGDELLFARRRARQHVVAVMPFVDDVVLRDRGEIVGPQADGRVVLLQDAVVVEILVEIPDQDRVVGAPGRVGILPLHVVGADVGHSAVGVLGVLDVVEPFAPEAGHMLAGVGG